VTLRQHDLQELSPGAAQTSSAPKMELNWLVPVLSLIQKGITAVGWSIAGPHLPIVAHSACPRLTRWRLAMLKWVSKVGTPRVSECCVPAEQVKSTVC